MPEKLHYSLLYFSSRLCLNVISDSEGAKTYESKRHSIEMVIQEKEGGVQFHLHFIKGEIKARNCDQDNIASLRCNSSHDRENLRRTAELQLAQSDSQYYFISFKSSCKKVFLVTSWLIAWGLFPFVQSVRQRKWNCFLLVQAAGLDGGN